MPDLVSLYERWGAAFAAEPEMSLDRWRAMVEEWPQLTAEPGGVDYVEVDAGGVPAIWIAPKGAAEDRGDPLDSRRRFRRWVDVHAPQAVRSPGEDGRRRALAPDYRRPPEHMHPAPLEDVVCAYEWLLGQGIEASHVAFTRDSAGGGMVGTAMFLARDRGLPLPAAGMPLSAWFALDGTGESQETNAGSDKFLNKRFGDQLADILLGESGDRRNPYVSALYGDLAGLPPLYLQVSDAETLLDDSRSFAEKARGAGVEVRLDVFPGQQHTFQMAAGRSPFADDAICRLADWVRPHLGL